MARRLLPLLLCVGALLGGCAYGVGEPGDEGSTAEEGAPLETSQPSTAEAEADPREPGKPQPDPWGRGVGPRDNTERADVDPGKPQPDPWRAPSATAATGTTSSK